MQLFYSNRWNNKINKENLEIINLYNEIFVPSSCIIESKISYITDLTDVSDGFIFLKKLNPKKENIIEEIHGGRLFIYINKKVMSLSGYFKNDNMNIIRDYKIFRKKSDEILEMLNLEIV